MSFDLEGDGIKTGVLITYDIDGDGKLDTINDSQDAILVFDKDGDGISGEDGSETFGDNTDLDGDGKKDGFSDGFAALKAYAAQFGLVGEGDNTLDENDLKILEEKGLKIKTDGYNSEGKSLLELGITEINLAQTTETTMIDNFDGNGNQLMTQEGATFKINGETRQYADLWHVKHENVPTQQKSLNIFDKALGQKSSYVATKKDNSKYEDMFKATKNKNKLVNAQTDSALNMMKQILKKYSK